MRYMDYKKIEITNIEEIKEDTIVCDISVVDDNSFVAEGVVVHNCKICISLDGGVHRLNPETGQHNGPLIPVHPLCFIKPNILIYTSEGTKKIIDIKKGNLVLTHKGRFKKVTDIIRYKKKEPVVITITAQYPKLSANKKHKPHVRKLSITPEHPMMINGEWKEARKIKKGDKLRYLAIECKRCGTLIPFDKKYCSASCNSKDITSRQWADPKYRDNISEKNRISMLEQYESGKRDPYATTKNARKACKKVFDKGEHPFQTQDITGDKNPAKCLKARKKISISKMGDKNPMRKYPHLAEEHSEWMKQYYIDNPEKHPNRIMSLKGHETGIEKKFREEMENRDLVFEKQHSIKRYYVDFAFPEHKIAIEVDGAYWHKDKEKDLKRQQDIELEGWTVLRYGEKRVNTEVDKCVDELCRVINNHDGEYKFIELEIIDTKKWIHYNKGRGGVHKNVTLYNFSVEGDESYIASGMVSHNCRCLYVAQSYSWQELAKRHNVPFDKRQKAFFDGAVTKTITYDAWLRTLPETGIGSQVEILGPARQKLWSSGQIKLSQMATSKRILTIEQLEAIAERELAKAAPFVPAKTIEEAKKGFNDFGIKTVRRMTQGPHKLTAEQFLDDALNPMLEEFDRIKRAFPEITIQLNKTKVFSSEFSRGKFLPELAGGSGSYNPSRRIIQIAVKDGAKNIKPSLSLGKKTFNVGGSEFRSNMRHELGHHYFEKVLVGTDAKVIKRNKFLNIWFRKGEKKYFKKNIGVYAGTDVNEAFAESFAAYTSPKYKKGMLPKDIEKYFDDLLKVKGK